MFGISKDALWAFGVHILTASGAFLAFLSIVATAENRFPAAFFWLGMALLVDGVDGPLPASWRSRSGGRTGPATCSIR